MTFFLRAAAALYILNGVLAENLWDMKEFEEEAVLNRLNAVQGHLEVRLIPSRDCMLDESEQSLLQAHPWGILKPIEIEDKSSDFIDSWIGMHPTKIEFDSTVNATKNAFIGLYQQKRLQCGSSYLRWEFVPLGLDTAIFTTIPLEFYADKALRTKSPVEIFSLGGRSSEGGDFLPESLTYARLTPEAIRSRQKGSLERRAPLRSPYIITTTEDTRHYHYLKPISNGWMTTPVQVQEEKTAREALKQSKHPHFPDSVYALISKSQQTQVEHEVVLLNGEANTWWTSEDGILKQRSPPAKKADPNNPDAKEHEGDNSIFGFIRRNWLYIFVGWFLLNIFFGESSEQGPAQGQGDSDRGSTPQAQVKSK